MKRRGFLKALGIGAAAAPLLVGKAQAVEEVQPLAEHAWAVKSVEAEPAEGSEWEQVEVAPGEWVYTGQSFMVMRAGEDVQRGDPVAVGADGDVVAYRGGFQLCIGIAEKACEKGGRTWVRMVSP